MIARRRQKHRYRTGHDDRMQDGLMAVTIDHDDVAWRDRGMPHHLVGRRRTVGDEIQVIAIEDTGRVTLRGRHWPRVVEQLPKLVHRVAHIGTQHVLTEKLVEHLPDRAFQEGDTTGMSGTMPRIRTVCSIVHQGPEEWRRQ
ncbi:hypothetical protein SDC9_197234 [bioreactor metagenome]|uniref:Uncharacterized protein n=1 Tax=bioreactor metagenome TaxID=1076179 RepID=A0A645IFK2_9ZZZZ